ncbi:MAG: HEPN domain-containing protein [Oligoflexia bacterium]|nr:HEPN domain-containing protein [Oligoflexia bacterium]
MDHKTRYWLELSEDDLSVIDILFDKQKLVHAMFFCHLVTEKILKAYYTCLIETTPPKTHNLLNLASETGLVEKLTNEQNNLLAELMPFNVEARYPTYKRKLESELSIAKVKEYISKTRELHGWIKKLIK